MSDGMDSPIYVEESGMRFGPFDPEYFFHVEKAREYQKYYSQGVKVTEFVYSTVAGITYNGKRKKGAACPAPPAGRV